MVNYAAAGGDGAALVAPSRGRSKIFKAYSVLFHSPDGRIAEVSIALMTRARWERHWRDATPTMRTIHAGPLVLVVGLTI